MRKFRMKKIGNVFLVSPVLMAMLNSGTLVYADQYYNPKLLLNVSQGNVADLSSFEQGLQLAGKYKAELYLNDEYVQTKEFNFEQTGEKNSITGGLTPCIDSQYFSSIGVKLYNLDTYDEIVEQSCVDLKKHLPDAEVVYNFNTERLDIQIPQIWVSQIARGYIPPSEWEQGITALTLDYNLNSSFSSGYNNFFASLNAGLNIAGFRLRNFSTYNRSEYKTSNYTQSKWSNIQTYAEKTLIPLKSELVLGDSYVQNNIFDGISFRGARLYSSDAMLPTSMQGYAPVVRGIANTKSSVTIRQNGYIVYQTNVAAGPFEINDLSSMSQSGDLDVTVEESSGATQHFVVPYSGVPILLRENQMTYDIAAGEYRSGNDKQDNPIFAQGTISRGFINGYTAYLGAQLASDYKSGVVGFGKNMGRWGAFSIDMTHANSRLVNNKNYSGQSYRFLYSKSLNEIGTTLQLMGYRYSTKGFYTLGDVAYNEMESDILKEEYDTYGNVYYDKLNYNNLNYKKKGRFQLHVNQNLGDMGSIYASAESQSYWNTSRSTRNIQVGYSNAFRALSYNVFWSQQNDLRLNGRKNNSLSVGVTIPLNLLFRTPSGQNNQVYSNNNYITDLSGNNSYQTGLNGVLMDENQLSYSVNHGHSDQSGEFGSVAVNYNSKFGQSSVGFNFANDNEEQSWSLNHAGGIILHSKGITLGQSLGDTNILVDTHGANNVKIENSTNIFTDRRGFAIIPYAESYRLNRVALETNTLDDKTEILNNVKNLVPTKGAVLRANFESRQGNRVFIKLNHQGLNIPYGAKVVEVNHNINSIVGTESRTYMSGLPNQGKLSVTWGKGEHDSCSANFALTANQIESPLAQLELNCQ